jgi:hypothetical protein
VVKASRVELMVMAAALHVVSNEARGHGLAGGDHAATKLDADAP